jgi:hypothetical protein
MANGDPTIIAVLLGGLGTLATVIGVLWKNTTSHFAAVSAKLDDCEDDRATLWHVIAKQAGRDVKELKREIEKE